MRQFYASNGSLVFRSTSWPELLVSSNFVFQIKDFGSLAQLKKTSHCIVLHTLRNIEHYIVVRRLFFIAKSQNSQSNKKKKLRTLIFVSLQSAVNAEISRDFKIHVISEAKNIWRNFPLIVLMLLIIASKQKEGHSKFLWPSQNILTLSKL